MRAVLALQAHSTSCDPLINRPSKAMLRIVQIQAAYVGPFRQWYADKIPKPAPSPCRNGKPNLLSMRSRAHLCAP